MPPPRAGSPLLNRSKRRGGWSARMPGPASVTSIRPGRTSGPDRRAAVLDRVADQVGDDPLQPAGIGDQLERRSVDPHPGRASRRRRGPRRRPRRRPPAPAGPAPCRRPAARSRAGRRSGAAAAQTSRDSSSASSRGSAAIDGAAASSSSASPTSAVKRRPQLVGDVGGEAALALAGGLQLGDLRLQRVGHLVEGRGPDGELVPALDQEPGVGSPRPASRQPPARPTGASVRRASAAPNRAESAVAASQPASSTVRG